MSSLLSSQALKLFVLFVNNPKVLENFLEEMGSMPNIQTPTMGGHVFWSNLVSHNGWRLQRNMVFGNCRILNPYDERIAWGSESAMHRIMDSVLINH